MILRKHGNLILSLCAMMISTGLPELSSEKDLNYLRETLVSGSIRTYLISTKVSLFIKNLMTAQIIMSLSVYNRLLYLTLIDQMIIYELTKSIICRFTE